MKKIYLPFVLALIPIFLVAQHTKKTRKQTKDVEIMELGSAATINGLSNGHKQVIFNNDVINTSVFIHTGGGSNASSDSAFDFVFDYSTNGGANWVYNIKIYDYPGNGINKGIIANGVIYNPTGNTNPANAWVVTVGMVNSGNWHSAAYVCAAAKLNGSMQHDTIIYPDAPGKGMDLINNCIITSSGEIWAVAAGVDSIGNTNAQYNDTIYFIKGNFNSSLQKFVWQKKKLHFPIPLYNNGMKPVLNNVKISFNNYDYGNLSFVTFCDTLQYETQTATIWYLKTTDGGENWSELKACPLQSIKTIQNFIDSTALISLFAPNTVPPRHTWLFTPIGETNMITDMHNQPHFITTVSFSKTNVNGVPGNLGYPEQKPLRSLFHIWYDEALDCWMAHEIKNHGHISASLPGYLNEANRPTIFSSANGIKIFMSWLETNEINYPSDGNNNPDIMLLGYDVINKNHTVVTNSTTGTDAEGACFMYAAPQNVRTISASEWEINYAFASWDTSTQQNAEFYYIKGLVVSGNEFTQQNNLTNFNHLFIQENPPSNLFTVKLFVDCNVPIVEGYTSLTPHYCNSITENNNQYTIEYNHLSLYNNSVTFCLQNVDGDLHCVDYFIGLDKIDLKNTLSIFPNPATSYFSVNISQQDGYDDAIIEVTDVLGNIIHVTTAKQNQINIPVQNWSEGLYLVQLKCGNLILAKEKIIIQR